jgi:hypothetical protein
MSAPTVPLQTVTTLGNSGGQLKRGIAEHVAQIAAGFGCCDYMLVVKLPNGAQVNRNASIGTFARHTATAIKPRSPSFSAMARLCAAFTSPAKAALAASNLCGYRPCRGGLLCRFCGLLKS